MCLFMSTRDIQEKFLTAARKNRLNVTVFLMNGFQIRGQITGHDAFVVVVLTDGKQDIIYKHAISTIVPERHVDLTAD